MHKSAKVISLTIATLLLTACWGQPDDEQGHTEAVEDCRSTKTLSNRMLNSDTTLSYAPGVCFMVPEQLTVGTEVRLDIEPGVRLIFAEDSGLTVHEGTLVARGTEDKPIVFTGRRRNPGSWSGVRFMNSAETENVLEYATIEYGGATPGYKGVEPANLMLDDYYGTVDVRVSKVTLRRSGGYGLYAEEDIHTTFTDNVLTENKRGAAHLHPVFIDHLDGSSSYVGNDVDIVRMAGAIFDRQRLSWPGLEVPYVVSGHIQLTGNSFVEIGPGATLKFEENTGVSVFRSRLAAEGKKDAPIVFTGQKEVPGYWRGIRFVDSNSVDNVLEHVAIRYGGANPTFKGVEPANLMLDDYYGKVRLRLHNTELSHSGQHGLYAEGKIELDFANNRLVDNERSSALLHPRIVGELDAESSYASKGADGSLEILGANLDGIEATWPSIDATYLVRGDILIRDDAHVTIEPGVTVAFSEGAGISVYRARLTARGAEDQPITFTGANPKPGYWKGIHLVDTSSVENVFEHVVIEYGGSARTFKGAEPANLMFDDYYGLVAATLNNVTSRHSGAAGMHIEGQAQIRSSRCSSIKIEDETAVTRVGKSLRRACRG